LKTVFFLPLRFVCRVSIKGRRVKITLIIKPYEMSLVCLKKANQITHTLTAGFKLIFAPSELT